MPRPACGSTPGSGAARERHAGYFEAFLARHRPALGREGCALREVGQELPNLRTALSWAAAGEEEGLLDSLAEGLGVYYSLAGHFRRAPACSKGSPDAPGCSWKGPACASGGASEAGGRACRGRAGAGPAGPRFRRLALAVLATTGEVLVGSGHASAGAPRARASPALAGEDRLYDEQTAIRLALGQALGAAGEPALARAQGERVRRRARRRGPTDRVPGAAPAGRGGAAGATDPRGGAQ